MIRSLERMKRADYIIGEEWGGGRKHHNSSECLIVEKNNRTSHAVCLPLPHHSYHFLKRPVVQEVSVCVCVGVGATSASFLESVGLRHRGIRTAQPGRETNLKTWFTEKYHNI